MKLVSLLSISCALLCIPFTTAYAFHGDKNLPLGDGKISSSAKEGFVWSCNNRFGGGGAFKAGEWIDFDAGVFSINDKPTVDGSVKWPSSIQINNVGQQRVVTTNDLPAHPSGEFPISRNDDAYQYDRNPNSIREQDFKLSLPLNPTVANSSSCLPMGAIGVLLSGSVVFNALDARGKDAVAHEIQDECQGHPERDGSYHYHNISSCIKDEGDKHSKLVGYALDGFGIYGLRGENGSVLSNNDLDVCHGHTHEVNWEGTNKSMYHYHATNEYPYTLGCFKGTPQSLEGVNKNSNPRAARGEGNGNRQGRGGKKGSQSNPKSKFTPKHGFSVITVGTGSPRYNPERSGPSTMIQHNNRYYVLDMGNGTQARFNEAGIRNRDIDALMFTHHHLDHNEEFVPLFISQLMGGNEFDVVGPKNTSNFVKFNLELYKEDIDYRLARNGKTFNATLFDVKDLSYKDSFKLGDISVQTQGVNHTIDTSAYRFNADGKSIVVSGDLTYSDSLIELATNADVLVIDSGRLNTANKQSRNGNREGSRERNPEGSGERANSGSRANNERRAGRRNQARNQADGEARKGNRRGSRNQSNDEGGKKGNKRGSKGSEIQAHASIEEVATMASKAKVRKLVLTHFGSNRLDKTAVQETISKIYSGEIIFADDMMEIDP